MSAEPASSPEAGHLLAEIQRLQGDVRAAQQRYQWLYDNLPHGYVSLDRNRMVADCNAAFLRIVGRGRSEVVGRDVLLFFNDDERHLIDHFLVSLTRRPGLQQGVELSLKSERSGEGPVFVSMYAVYLGEAEPPLSYIVAMEDITRKVRLEEEQRIARRQLYRSARLASIGTLASGVAHEINNPLTAILGFSSSLLDRVRRQEPVSPEELQEYLGVIASETMRCRDIIQNLSTFAQESDAQVHDVSLVDSVNAAVKLMSSRAYKRNMRIVNEIDADRTLKADANRLTQVLVNVISNALDFCDEGCSVTIGAEEPKGRGDFVRLTVRDNGPGIPQSVLPKVFDPFFTTKEVGKGAGLGLAICHKIVEEFNGTIDIISERGGGTTVVIDIPRSA